jgi:hypothetical protein
MQRSAVVGVVATVALVGLASGIVHRCTEPQKFSAEPPRPAQSSEAAASTMPALSLAWGGSAEANFDAQRLNQDHRASLHFMAAYEAAFRGVLLADESGSYRLSVAPYASLGAAAVEVSVGGATFTYPLPAPALTDNDFRDAVPTQPLAKWRRLAVSRRGALVTITLDGVNVGELTAGSLPAKGKLQLGRLAHPDGPQDQFYGFIDDIVIDEAPLAPSALSLRGSASVVQVSSSGDAERDAQQLPAPAHTTRFSLPFPEEQVWLVIQGANSALSHNDIAAFALDFIRVDPRFVRENPGRRPGGSHRATDGAPLVAAARGRVVSLVDCFADDNSGRCANTGGNTPTSAGQLSARNRNLVCVEHRAGETTCLLHLQQQSARVRLDTVVERGATLGLAGNTGVPTPHLHFALCNHAEPNEPGAFSELVTLPVAFDDYFASDDFGQSWHHVPRGTPTPGQWVARVEPALRSR